MRRLEEYVNVGQKRLRCGYTTGTCAAAAARAAAELLFTGVAVPVVVVDTPAGVRVPVEVEVHEAGAGWAVCGVRKDAGDDADVTDGALVLVRVERVDVPGVRIVGGPGVGVVTLPGLDQPVGEAAINSVPRGMIVEAVTAAWELSRGGEPGGGGVAGGGEDGGGGSMLKQSSLCEMPTGHFSRCGTARGTPAPILAAWDGDGGSLGSFSGPSLLSEMPGGHFRRIGGGYVVDEPGTSLGEGELGCDSVVKRFSVGEGSLGHFGRIGDDFVGDSPGTSLGEEELGVLVTVSVPGGKEMARRTFNGRMGIVGGISIIGTSGIVRPMSEDAMVAAIELELKVLAAGGRRDVLVVPGNYGRDFARSELGLDVASAVSCSNYFGDTIDAAVRLGFRRMLIVGHLGKMAKVAAGIMNTHSRVADCRVEVLAAHAALVGAGQAVVAGIMESATTDAALEVLASSQLLDDTMGSLVGSLQRRLGVRAGSSLQVEAIVFTKQHGLLGQTPHAAELARVWEYGTALGGDAAGAAVAGDAAGAALGGDAAATVGGVAIGGDAAATVGGVAIGGDAAGTAVAGDAAGAVVG